MISPVGFWFDYVPRQKCNKKRVFGGVVNATDLSPVTEKCAGSNPAVPKIILTVF